MKITIMVGKIHLLKFLFVVVASRSSSEENYLGKMSRSNLNNNLYGRQKLNGRNAPDED